ncbi:hypothetical protein [Georgenia sp. Z1491]|uniref:hypothetical protein n=1 Tax=Georgenia sp. Z1491 TaxID=3416707 RepID=UPI003CF7BEF1
MHEPGSSPTPPDREPPADINTWTVDPDAMALYQATVEARAITFGSGQHFSGSLAAVHLTPPVIVLVDDPLAQAAEVLDRAALMAAEWDDDDEDDEEWEVVVIEEWDWDDDDLDE